MNRADRNNNPTNIKVPQGGLLEAKKRYGDENLSVDPSPASDGGQFLKFSSPDKGFQATSTLLKLGYSDMPVDAALKRWSGNGYGGDVAPDLASKKIADLNPDEMSTLTQSMAKREGYTGKPGLLQNALGIKTANAQTTESSDLKNEDRTKLDGIVQQMISNKEPEQNIQSVVNDFKHKYTSKQNQESVQQETTQSEPSQTDKSGGLLSQFATGVGSTILGTAKLIGDALGLKPTEFGQKLLNSSDNLDEGTSKTLGQIAGVIGQTGLTAATLKSLLSVPQVAKIPSAKTAILKKLATWGIEYEAGKGLLDTGKGLVNKYIAPSITPSENVVNPTR